MKKSFLYFFIFIFLYKKCTSNIYEVKILKMNNNPSFLRYLESTDELFFERVHGSSGKLNYYYATLYLGKKKTPQTYILDTGSTITTSPCNKCNKNCGKHLNKYYEIDDDSKIISCSSEKCSLVSKKCSSNQCSFHISYMEGSKLNGFFVNEDVYFETLINNKDNLNETNDIKLTDKFYNIPIGCTTEETHLFKNQLADGIMGLNNNPRSFISMLYKTKVIKKDLFTLCLSQEGGYFSIGEININYHKSKDIKYLPLDMATDNYHISLNSITIDNHKINNKYSTFIDSGTTISYFPKNMFDEIINEVKKIWEEKGKTYGTLKYINGIGYCVIYKDGNQFYDIIYKVWPNIILEFKNYEFKWIPENYYFIFTKSKIMHVCLGFDQDQRSKITLGTTFMHGYDIIFDKSDRKIGLVQSDCERKKRNDFDKENEEKKENNEKKENKEKEIKVNETKIEVRDEKKNENIKIIVNETKKENETIKGNERINQEVKNVIENKDKSEVKIIYGICIILFIIFCSFSFILLKESYFITSGIIQNGGLPKDVINNVDESITKLELLSSENSS